jgi:NAD(P)-dependent dehydrogenase (short-subunit alcohol dehydrogenase family)
LKLQGKVAVITGAGSGIGRATAQIFAREGAQVTVADWNPAGGHETVSSIEREFPGRAMFSPTDVGSEAQVREMIRLTVERFGRLDILVNNAADREPGQPVADLPEEEWDRTLATTLKGAYLCAKHAIPEMRRQGAGVIVNVSSMAAVVSFANAPAYGAAKAGMVQLTRNIALDYAADNIRANSVLPGAIETPGLARALARPGWLEATLERILLKRLGQPEEIAKVILFLASDESSYLTGAAITADGGWTIR